MSKVSGSHLKCRPSSLSKVNVGSKAMKAYGLLTSIYTFNSDSVVKFMLAIVVKQKLLNSNNNFFKGCEKLLNQY